MPTQHQRNPSGRLQARPQPIHTAAPHGLHQISKTSNALLHVPASYDPARAAPLLVALHGAGGNAQHGLALLEAHAEAMGTLILAPASQATTWDVIINDFGPDTTHLDQLLATVLASYHVDPQHVAIAGFSDGASYALSLGIMNGDLFGHVIAFSPGFIAPNQSHGQPRIFITHGTEDRVLPIQKCSRRIVPLLQHADYAVEYHEFDGPHTIPANLASVAMTWFLQ